MNNRGRQGVVGMESRCRHIEQMRIRYGGLFEGVVALLSRRKTLDAVNEAEQPICFSRCNCLDAMSARRPWCSACKQILSHLHLCMSSFIRE